MMANLQVRIVRDDFQNLSQQFLAFHFCYVVDMHAMQSTSENGFPPRDWMGSDERVDGGDIRAYIFRGATWSLIDTTTCLLCSLGDTWLIECASQAVEKPLIRLREAIVYFITGSPHGV